MIEKLKKINRVLINITNFFLVLIIYFIGVGMSHLSWKFSKSIRKEKYFLTYWLKSEELEKDIKEYLKQF